MRKLFILSALLILMPPVAIAAVQGRVTEAMVAGADGEDRLSQADFQAHRLTAFMQADFDKDGRISADEWARGVAQLRDYMQRKNITGWQSVGKGNLFAKLDTDKDGFLSEAEINAFTAARFAKIDTSHDGYIDASEAKKVKRMFGN